MSRIEAHLLHTKPRKRSQSDDWEYYDGFTSYPTEVYVEDRPHYTELLDADGEPYEIVYQTVGFDLGHND